MADRLKRYIIDTDVGGDPDDALAIVQACELGNVAAFVTSDETPDGARARFVQQLISEAGRDIPVFTGFESPYSGKHLLGKMAVASSPQPPSIRDGFMDLMSNPDNIHWVGIGSYTNLAWVGRQLGCVEGMEVTLMGGRLAQDPITRLEHNVKVDPEATLMLPQFFKNITFVPSTVTMSEKLAVDSTHPALGVLHDRGMRLALDNFRTWFEHKYPKSYQHDLATLAYATGLVSAAVKRVRINREGRLVDDGGFTMKAVYQGFEYQQVWRWFNDVQASQ